MSVPLRSKGKVFPDRESKKPKMVQQRFEETKVSCKFKEKDICPVCLERTDEILMVFRSAHASCPVCFLKCGCLK